MEAWAQWTRFEDRRAAGQRLARAVRPDPDALVLALPRGGVPVAAELARAHGLELDVLPVRKLGVPGHPELAAGAIGPDAPAVYNQGVLRALRLEPSDLTAVEARERAELERRSRSYRGDRPQPRVAGREVWLVDDGLATGATMRAAIRVLRAQHPARLAVAVPVAPPDTAAEIRAEVDAFVCLLEPEPFEAVGRWYRAFGQVPDAAVVAALRGE